MLVVPKNWTQIDFEVLELSVEPYNEEELPKKVLDWTIIDYQSTGMTIQSYFEDPLYISDDVFGKDRLVIKLLNPDWFFSSSSLSTIKNMTEIEETLQRQISPDMES